MKQVGQTKSELREIDLSSVIRYVNENHDGNLLFLVNWLDKAIYMFHYLPEDTFTEIDRQNTCHILMELKETLMEVYCKEKGWQYNS